MRGLTASRNTLKSPRYVQMLSDYIKINIIQIVKIYFGQSKNIQKIGKEKKERKEMLKKYYLKL